MAVLFRVEVHVLDGWLAPGAGAAGGWWCHALRLLGGLAAPGFLYMAGISQAWPTPRWPRPREGAQPRGVHHRQE